MLQWINAWRSSPHRAIGKLAGPIFFSNITIPLLGVVDTAVMGHLDDPVYLAGVALGSALIGFLWWLMNFLRMGTTGLCAQYVGQGHIGACYSLLRQGLLLGLAIACLLILFHRLLFEAALYWTAHQPEVSALARDYVSIRIWGAPAYFAFYVFHGWLLGRQNAIAPVSLLIVINIINIILDLWFVVGLGWGVKGAAYASLISEYLGVCAAGIVVMRYYWIERQAVRESTGAGLNFVGFFAVNRDILLRSLMLQLCFLSIPYLGSQQSETTMAANAILQNMLMVLAFALDAYAHAAEALVGKAIGRRSHKETTSTIIGCFGWAFITSTLFSLLFWIAQLPIIHLLTDIPEVVAEVSRYWFWIVWLPLIAVACFTWDGVFIGAARARDMRNNMAWAAGLGFMPCAWGLLPYLGNHAVWLGIWLLMIIRGLGLGATAWKLHQRGWQHLAVA